MSTQQTVSADACVVIDCNEWIRLKWLGSPIGLTLIAALKRDRSLRLAIPEILGGELDKHRAETASSLLRRLRDVSADIGTVTGDHLAAGMVTLTEESVEVLIRERLLPIAEQAFYPDMTLEEVRRALIKVNAEVPPNGPKNQQMKDSLLWESCVTLAGKYCVYLITGDKAFYRDRHAEKGLAENLSSEPAVKDGRLKVFPSLESALQVFAPESSADSGEIVSRNSRDLIAEEASNAFLRSSVAADIPEARLRLRGVVPTYFRTEVPHVFATSFTAFFNVEQDAEAEGKGEAAVSGECRLDTRQATIDSVSLHSIHWRLPDAAGGVAKVYEVLDGRVGD
ncbi:hypothetical protein [Micromonospora aurantiaca]|uniref:DUF4935 domain-containing protein n=1 Tax=Micromonospora aurantiaca (nom. illeg.) TaxID=47850 RepID=A0ABQ6UPM3_9ACTN|nr:hypothetical protein [Micromonospora aurantiaca]KAB1119123.1 hypothetical protein F6X54_00065 [Micromonospora aurantiaca]UFN96271.1 hypothetical protein LF814_09110 [Micromonospora aurantiaca]